MQIESDLEISTATYLIPMFLHKRQLINIIHTVVILALLYLNIA